MDAQAQEKISKLMIEQAEKLGKALHALRRIGGVARDTDIGHAREIANNVLREIADYGKDPKSL